MYLAAYYSKSSNLIKYLDTLFNDISQFVRVEQKYEYHTTIMYDTVKSGYFDFKDEKATVYLKDFDIFDYYDDKCLVIKINCDTFMKKYDLVTSQGFKYPYTYTPHITLCSFNKQHINKISEVIEGLQLNTNPFYVNVNYLCEEIKDGD